MASAAEISTVPYTAVEQLREARHIVRGEAAALEEISRRLDAGFCAACQLLYACDGSVIVTGMGKAGIIGQKITATLSSTGTRAHFLHPAEAVHGDIGCLHASDVLLALSHSGETDEICRLLPIVRRMNVPIVAITGGAHSTLGSQADVVVSMGRVREMGVHGLAPSTSTTVMLALGDALALVVSRMKAFTPRQFALFHPAGSLGRQLQTVGEVMRPLGELRVAQQDESVRDVFVRLSRPGRRTGAVILLDEEGRLTGLFTDSDLARLLEQRREEQLDRPIHQVMTHTPLTVRPDALLGEAVDLLSGRKVSELPVVDGEGRPVGMIDITDVIGLMPAERAE